MNLCAHLCDVHTGITAERLGGHQAIGADEGGQHSSLIDLLDSGPIHKVHKAPFVHCNTCIGRQESCAECASVEACVCVCVRERGGRLIPILSDVLFNKCHFQQTHRTIAM